MRSADTLLNAEPGALNEKQMLSLSKSGLIQKMVTSRNAIDGSALDLHLSNEAWQLERTSKLRSGERVRDLLVEKASMGAKAVNLEREVLQKGKVYIVRLREIVRFAKFEDKLGLYGRASGKSSVGRVDVLTRLLVDYTPKYDEIPPDYNGKLFLEVIPISFSIKVKEGVSLHQLRVFKGKPELSLIQSEDLSRCAPMLYYDNGKPVEGSEGILRVNLKPDKTLPGRDDIVAFVAKDNTPDLDLRESREKPKADPKQFWEPERRSEFGLSMKTDKFYILRSKERLFVPNDVTVSCVAYSENLGELRIHYAGFAHPNFGRRREDEKIGAPLIFEARCHTFGVVIRDNEQFAKIEFYRMSQASKKTSQYTGQELKLSNFFRDWS